MFSTIKDLTKFFKNKQLQELQSGCQSPEIMASILNRIEFPEDFVIVCHSIELEKLEILLEALEREQDFRKVFRNLEDLKYVLKQLDYEKIPVVCHTLNAMFFEIIQTAINVNDVLKDLTPERCVAFYESFKDEFFKLIKKGSNFKDLLCDLTIDQHTAIYESIREDLPRVILNPNFDFRAKELNTILRELLPEQCSTLCGTFKAEFFKLIKTGSDFKDLFYGLTDQQHIAVYESIKKDLPEIILNFRTDLRGKAFNVVLSELTAEQYLALCRNFKDEFFNLIKKGSNFKDLLCGLGVDLYIAIYESIKEDLSRVILNPDFDFRAKELNTILRELLPEQCSTLCESFKAEFFELIKTGSDFKDLFYGLTDQQHIAVYESIKKDLPEIILNFRSDLRAKEFNVVLSELTAEQCLMLCESVKANFSILIKNASDLKDLFHELKAEYRTIIYKSIKDNISEIIQCGNDLQTALDVLTRPQFIELYESFKDRVFEMIQCKHDFQRVVRILKPESRKEFCECIKIKLPEMIDNAHDVQITLRAIALENCRSFCENSKSKLLEIISANDVCWSEFEPLTLEKFTVFWESIKEHIMIQNEIDLKHILSGLDPVKCRVVCESFKDKLPEIIKDVAMLYGLMSSLGVGERVVVYEAFQEKLPEMIKSDRDLRMVLRMLPCEPGQYNIFFEFLKKSEIQERIQRPDTNLQEVLRGITPEKFKIICESISERLPEIIRTLEDARILLSTLTPDACEVICKSANKIFWDLLQTRQDLKDLLRDLTSEQCQAVCWGIKDTLCKFAPSEYKLKALIRELPSEQGMAVVYGISDSEVIKDVRLFKAVLGLFLPEDRAKLFESLKHRLRVIIQNVWDFDDALHGLPLEQCVDVYETVKNIFPDIILNSASSFDKKPSFAVLWRNLTPEQRIEVYDIVKGDILVIIQHNLDFRDLLQALTPSQCEEICEVAKEKYPVILPKTVADFRIIFSALTPTKCKALCNSLKDQLVSVIRNKKDVDILFQPFNSESESKQEVRSKLISCLKKLGDIPEDAKSRLLFFKENPSGESPQGSNSSIFKRLFGF